MAESYNTNLLNVASCYIHQLNIGLTYTTLKKTLLENPYYPSLYSLSNTFDRCHIPHNALKIEKENFEQLIPPFIAYLKSQPTGKDFVLVTSIHSDKVNYISENKKTKTTTKVKFLEDFENIILQAQVTNNEKIGEKDYALNHKKEITKANKRNAIILASAFILIATNYYFIHSLPVHFMVIGLGILAIKIFGLAIAILLLIHEIDKSNAFVKSICTAGKQTNCNAVLQSSASKILGMNWSEIGFFYFVSTLLFLWFPDISFSTKIFVVTIANLMAAPYILFSVYYQWKVVKQWCPLCLMVQAVLLTELIWAIANFWLSPYLPSVSFLAIALPVIYCLVIPIASWYIIKPLLFQAKTEPVYKAAYKRLLYNPDTFNNLLQQQANAPDGYENIGITIGNSNAVITIIKVCNPYCGPCAKAHPVIDEILENNTDVKLKLIFTASNDLNDKRGTVARHLLAINKKGDQQEMQHALDDWYLADKKDYAVFADKYPMSGELKQQETEIEKMIEWCKQAEIVGTPTFFINGKRLPETYSFNELRYIL